MITKETTNVVYKDLRFWLVIAALGVLTVLTAQSNYPI